MFWYLFTFRELNDRLLNRENMRQPHLSVQTPGTLPRGAETTPPVTPTGPDEKDSQDVLRYTDDAQIHHDSHDQPVEFGRGVWSTVYKASSVPKPTEIMTPPSSPATSSGRIVAIKVPTRRDAYPVLETEARILTRLVRAAGAEHHVVPFWGIVPRSHALVMDAVPATLSGYIEEQAERVKGQRDTKTLFEPVLGLQGWLGLCRALVCGLDWLHGNSIVHGDIKPHNILLRRVRDANDDNNTDNDTDLPYTPLFADFSSAHELHTTAANTNTMTALTPPFTAPELLVLSSLKSPDIAPTPASDVFSLAVTLLAAATGDLLLYPGANNMQRLAMAREGHRVVEFARSGISGCRVHKDGIVERVVAPAVVKVPEERVGTVEWVDIANGICGSGVRE